MGESMNITPKPMNIKIENEKGEVKIDKKLMHTPEIVTSKQLQRANFWKRKDIRDIYLKSKARDALIAQLRACTVKNTMPVHKCTGLQSCFRDLAIQQPGPIRVGPIFAGPIRVAPL